MTSSPFRWVGWVRCGPCFSGEVESSAKMRQKPGSPPIILPAFVALALVTVLPQLSSGVMPFPQDLEPISTVGREGKHTTSCVAGIFGYLTMSWRTKILFNLVILIIINLICWPFMKVFVFWLIVGRHFSVTASSSNGALSSLNHNPLGF